MATSHADLQAEIKKNEEQLVQLRKQAEVFRNQERTAVIDDLREKIMMFGLTAADLKLSRSGKIQPKASSAPVKYRGPAGEPWSGGRGRKPRWVTEALAAGKSLSDFEVKSF